MRVIDKEVLYQTVQSRKIDSHKGNYGKILLIGGHDGYRGAIIMAAKACVYSGAGLVTVATDYDNIAALHSHVPEAMAIDIAKDEQVKKHIQQADVIVIGCGLSQDELARRVFQQVLTLCQRSQRLVIDGSALGLLSLDQLNDISAQTIVLTPHQKEWERLSGMAICNQQITQVQETLQDYPDNVILVLKSSRTHVYTDHKETPSILTVGGPYQATGGMGDVLAGMIGGFLGQFHSELYQIVESAVYLHSYIAQKLSDSSYVVLPTQIIREIPYFMKKAEINELTLEK